MHILIAPNAFKQSLDADKAALAIRRGFEQSKLNCTCECFPVGDGGDGTGFLITNKCGGVWEETLVENSMGRPMKASFGLIEAGKTAVIEMANTSGLRLLDPNELNPLLATSFGTGQQIKVALEKRVRKIIITMGGSSTVDGGTGILRALGVRFLNANKKELSSSPSDLSNLCSIDVSGIDKRIKRCSLIVLCDVQNRLLGKHGAANIFGPQKGATPTQVKILDKALTKLSQVILRQTNKDISAIKYGGTAGGAAAGLYAILDAKLVNGIEYFLDLTDFDSALQRSSLVITAEGSIDEQTLKGKGPFGVASRAKQKGLPVIGLSGNVPLVQNARLQEYFDVLMAIGNMPSNMSIALSDTAKNLTRTARQVGNLLAIGQ